MSDKLFEEILKMAKNECRVTWSDEDTDFRMGEIVGAAIPTMARRLGEIPVDEFLKPGMERRLLAKYCLYDWNNALDEFESRYAHEILALRRKWGVKLAKAKV